MIISDEVSYFSKDPKGVRADNVPHRVSGCRRVRTTVTKHLVMGCGGEESGVWK